MMSQPLNILSQNGAAAEAPFRTPSAGNTPLGIRARLFRGLSDNSRLSILEALLSGPRNVSEIVDGTGLSQSNASNHLGCLLDCGLVAREQRGRFVFYSLSDERVAELLRTADHILTEVAHGVEACRRYERPEGE